MLAPRPANTIGSISLPAWHTEALSMHRRCSFLTPLALLLLTPAVFGATYYISPDGSNDNSGSQQHPWKTIAKANEMLGPGDTVILAAGRYEGLIEPARSGRKDAPITFRSEPSQPAVILGADSSDGYRTCIRLKDRQYIVIEGLRLLPSRGGWMKLDQASHCVIRDCHMEAAIGVYNPVECRDCHYNRYTNLTCLRSLNVGTYGHVLGDLWNNFASSHNAFERIHISRAGHRPFGFWHDCPNNVVRDCVFDCRWGRQLRVLLHPASAHGAMRDHERIREAPAPQTAEPSCSSSTRSSATTSSTATTTAPS